MSRLLYLPLILCCTNNKALLQLSHTLNMIQENEVKVFDLSVTDESYVDETRVWRIKL